MQQQAKEQAMIFGESNWDENDMVERTDEEKEAIEQKEEARFEAHFKLDQELGVIPLEYKSVCEWGGHSAVAFPITYNGESLCVCDGCMELIIELDRILDKDCD